ncbi:helix-turn-helix domain-containing protein [Dysgonomonas massiliensis]|uniref:helix-turn-helix domain-containing protein n=1 Tax=Dysgonomonas massiliensis TaxID=2040292 RepID=UPI000C7782CA|nr:helix-turn-helix domain-containing protein [Dysgonomonas massiliensis]
MSLITEKDEQIKSFFEALSEILTAIENALKDSKPLLQGEHYLTDSEVSDKLKIARRTLQDYRTQGLISYVKLGGKILYKSSDLEKLLSDNYCEKWS